MKGKTPILIQNRDYLSSLAIFKLLTKSISYCKKHIMTRCVVSKMHISRVNKKDFECLNIFFNSFPLANQVLSDSKVTKYLRRFSRGWNQVFM